MSKIDWALGLLALGGACGDADTSELELTAVTQLDASTSPTPALDAQLFDAAPEADIAAREAAAADAAPAVTSACPFANECDSQAYPCAVSSDGAGYSCVGQVAAWPMPDSAPDSKVRPSYQVQADVVFDEVTKLLWEREPPRVYPGCTRSRAGEIGDGCTLAEAQAYCAQLGLAGVRWRLPAGIELISIVDFARAAPAPKLASAFPDDVPHSYWAQVDGRGCGSPDGSWRCDLDLRHGHVVGGIYPTEAKRVRCVHDERVPDAPPSRGLVMNGLRIEDRYTQLEWQFVEGEQPTLDDARAACAALGQGFRVPTIKELYTSATWKGQPSADPALARLGPDDLLWSSTPSSATAVHRWSVYGEQGLLESWLPSTPSPRMSVRCVR